MLNEFFEKTHRYLRVAIITISRTYKFELNMPLSLSYSYGFVLRKNKEFSLNFSERNVDRNRRVTNIFLEIVVSKVFRRQYKIRIYFFSERFFVLHRRRQLRY